MNRTGDAKKNWTSEARGLIIPPTKTTTTTKATCSNPTALRSVGDITRSSVRALSAKDLALLCFWSEARLNAAELVASRDVASHEAYQDAYAFDFCLNAEIEFMQADQSAARRARHYGMRAW